MSGWSFVSRSPLARLLGQAQELTQTERDARGQPHKLRAAGLPPQFEATHTVNLGVSGEGLDVRRQLFPLQLVAWPEPRVRTSTALSFSPCGGFLAIACNDGTVAIEDVDTHELACMLVAHESGVTHVAWSSCSTRLATAGADSCVRVWDVATATMTAQLFLPGLCRGVSFCPGDPTALVVLCVGVNPLLVDLRKPEATAAAAVGAAGVGAPVPSSSASAASAGLGADAPLRRVAVTPPCFAGNATTATPAGGAATSAPAADADADAAGAATAAAAAATAGSVGGADATHPAPVWQPSPVDLHASDTISSIAALPMCEGSADAHGLALCLRPWLTPRPDDTARVYRSFKQILAAASTGAIDPTAVSHYMRIKLVRLGMVPRDAFEGIPLPHGDRARSRSRHRSRSGVKGSDDAAAADPRKGVNVRKHNKGRPRAARADHHERKRPSRTMHKTLTARLKAAMREVRQRAENEDPDGDHDGASEGDGAAAGDNVDDGSDSDGDSGSGDSTDSGSGSSGSDASQDDDGGGSGSESGSEAGSRSSDGSRSGDDDSAGGSGSSEDESRSMRDGQYQDKRVGGRKRKRPLDEPAPADDAAPDTGGDGDGDGAEESSAAGAASARPAKRAKRSDGAAGDAAAGGEDGGSTATGGASSGDDGDDDAGDRDGAGGGLEATMNFRMRGLIALRGKQRGRGRGRGRGNSRGRSRSTSRQPARTSGDDDATAGAGQASEEAPAIDAPGGDDGGSAEGGDAADAGGDAADASGGAAAADAEASGADASTGDAPPPSPAPARRRGRGRGRGSGRGRGGRRWSQLDFLLEHSSPVPAADGATTPGDDGARLAVEVGGSLTLQRSRRVRAAPVHYGEEAGAQSWAQLMGKRAKSRRQSSAGAGAAAGEGAVPRATATRRARGGAAQRGRGRLSRLRGVVARPAGDAGEGWVTVPVFSSGLPTPPQVKQAAPAEGEAAAQAAESGAPSSAPAAVPLYTADGIPLASYLGPDADAPSAMSWSPCTRAFDHHAAALAAAPPAAAAHWRLLTPPRPEEGSCCLVHLPQRDVDAAHASSSVAPPRILYVGTGTGRILVYAIGRRGGSGQLTATLLRFLQLPTTSGVNTLQALAPPWTEHACVSVESTHAPPTQLPCCDRLLVSVHGGAGIDVTNAITGARLAAIVLGSDEAIRPALSALPASGAAPAAAAPGVTPAGTATFDVFHGPGVVPPPPPVGAVGGITWLTVVAANDGSVVAALERGKARPRLHVFYAAVQDAFKREVLEAGKPATAWPPMAFSRPTQSASVVVTEEASTLAAALHPRTLVAAVSDRTGTVTLLRPRAPSHWGVYAPFLKQPELTVNTAVKTLFEADRFLPADMQGGVMRGRSMWGAAGASGDAGDGAGGGATRARVRVTVRPPEAHAASSPHDAAVGRLYRRHPLPPRMDGLVPVGVYCPFYVRTDKLPPADTGDEVAAGGASSSSSSSSSSSAVPASGPLVFRATSLWQRAEHSPEDPAAAAGGSGASSRPTASSIGTAAAASRAGNASEAAEALALGGRPDLMRSFELAPMVLPTGAPFVAASPAEHAAAVVRTLVSEGVRTVVGMTGRDVPIHWLQDGGKGPVAAGGVLTAAHPAGDAAGTGIGTGTGIGGAR